MQFRTVLAGMIITVAAGVAIGLAPGTSTPVVADATSADDGGHFVVDSGHSSVIFRVGHLGVANFIGRFNMITGSYDYDPANPTASSFDITIPVESLDCNSENRDGHLKSIDFFNAAEFPELTFKSTGVKTGADGMLKVDGDITMHGVTKSITVDMKLIGMADTRQGYKSGFDSTFTIKRTEFGMTKYAAPGGIGDEVTITVCLEGRRVDEDDA